jgi:hypothetical protein
MGPVDDSVTTATKSQKRYKVTKSHKVGDDRGDSQRGRVGGRLLAKMLVTKNRSRQRSTPRHPIAMASTAKPPYPMPCALAAVLLPESRAHGCHMQKTLFPGQSPHVHGGIRARPMLRGRSRSDALGAGTPGCVWHGGYRWKLEALEACCLRQGGSEGESTPKRVGEWWAGRRCVFPLCGVGHAWSLGLVRRLPLWLFQGCCSGGRLGPLAHVA